MIDSAGGCTSRRESAITRGPGLVRLTWGRRSCGRCSPTRAGCWVALMRQPHFFGYRELYGAQGKQVVAPKHLIQAWRRQYLHRKPPGPFNSTHARRPVDAPNRCISGIREGRLRIESLREPDDRNRLSGRPGFPFQWMARSRMKSRDRNRLSWGGICG